MELFLQEKLWTFSYHVHLRRANFVKWPLPTLTFARSQTPSSGEYKNFTPYFPHKTQKFIQDENKSYFIRHSLSYKLANKYTQIKLHLNGARWRTMAAAIRNHSIGC